MSRGTCLGCGLSRFRGYPYPTLYLSSRPKPLSYSKNRSKINQACPVQSTLQHSTVFTTWVSGMMSLIGRKGQESIFGVRGLYLAVGGQCCVSDLSAIFPTTERGARLNQSCPPLSPSPSPFQPLVFISS